MPIYDFVCNNVSCDYHDVIIEHFGKYREDVLCSRCNHVLRQLLSAPHGVVKGTSTPCTGYFQKNKG